MKLDKVIESDLSDNEEQYSKLKNDIFQLDNSHRVKAPTRRELSSVVSEFHLSKVTSGKSGLINVKELTDVLKGRRAHIEIGKKVDSVIKKAKTLPKPLEKPVAERLKRVVGYKNIKQQLKKWNAIVEKNRVADHLSFPLQQGRVTLQSSQQFLNKFKLKTPLELKMTEILEGAKKEEEELESEINKKLEFPLTLDEILEKKKELARIRAKLSYQEAKAHRQSRIKSKKYHRILKREKMKQQIKEFELLQKTNPEAALKKLEELDKSRAQERASLRHKNTGKWAKNLAVRAKYDKESRKVLAEQLKLGKDLTEKIRNVESDEDLYDDEEETDNLLEKNTFVSSSDNPWAIKQSSEVLNFVAGCNKYWENKNKENQSNAVDSVDSGSKHSNSQNTTVVVDKEKKLEGCKKSNSIENLTNCPVSPQDSNQSGVKTPDRAETGTIKTMVDVSKIEISDSCKKKLGDIVKKPRRVKVNDKDIKPKSNSKIRDSSKSSVENNSVLKMKRNRNRESRNHRSLNIQIQSSSGPWAVAEVIDCRYSKRKASRDIDDLFQDLDEKLSSKVSKKLKKIHIPSTKEKIYEEEEKSFDSDADDDLTMKKNPLSLRPDIDEELAETTGREAEAVVNVEKSRNVLNVTDIVDTPMDIDPKKFLDVKPKHLNTKLPEEIADDDNYIDDEEKIQLNDIIEAFGDDDVIEEFQQMKKEEEEATKLEIPSELPGWGSWGGADIDPNKIRRKKMMNIPKLPPRKDHNKKDIIIRERANEKAVEHMVKEVPLPFLSVGAFESNIRHPVGREWNPETAHREFIKKPIETVMGAIIEPMDEKELLRLKKEQKSLYRKKEKGEKV